MEYNLSEMETELAEIIWEREPIKSSELVDICAEAFDWKKNLLLIPCSKELRTKV